MKNLTLEHFYYGAILTSIMEYNPDASLVLLQPQNDTRKIYHIQTNSSQECVIYLKYGFEKKEGAKSWQYTFSENDKQDLKEWYEKKTPIFIYLLCGVKTLKDSKIAILRYDEFLDVINKKNFTISLKKGTSKFHLHLTRSLYVEIPTNRIEQKFDCLINDIVKVSHGYYCPNCGHALKN